MKVETSNGDLIDRVTILHIKSSKITNTDQNKNILNEYTILLELMKSIGVTVNSMEYQRLLTVNTRLWDVEDKLRVIEKSKQFDTIFIELARQVYYMNDERAAIKKDINLKTGSLLIEEKSYGKY